MTIDLGALGTFDVVLFLGVLYHLRDPLQALERLRTVTGEVAVIESQVNFHPASEHRALCEFLERDEVADDATSWWVPNLKALTGLCRAAGFRSVRVCLGPPPGLAGMPPDAAPFGYRAVVQAYP